MPSQALCAVAGEHARLRGRGPGLPRHERPRAAGDERAARGLLHLVPRPAGGAPGPDRRRPEPRRGTPQVPRRNLLLLPRRHRRHRHPQRPHRAGLRPHHAGQRHRPGPQRLPRRGLLRPAGRALPRRGRPVRVVPRHRHAQGRTPRAHLRRVARVLLLAARPPRPAAAGPDQVRPDLSAVPHVHGPEHDGDRRLRGGPGQSEVSRPPHGGRGRGPHALSRPAIGPRLRGRPARRHRRRAQERAVRLVVRARGGRRPRGGRVAAQRDGRPQLAERRRPGPAGVGRTRGPKRRSGSARKRRGGRRDPHRHPRRPEPVAAAAV